MHVGLVSRAVNHWLIIQKRTYSTDDINCIEYIIKMYDDVKKYFCVAIKNPVQVAEIL